MEDYNIYIVACTNGLNTLYKSNDFSYSKDDLNSLDEDERIDATQFAPSSTYFSCEVTKNLRIYSLINSKSLDNFGRSGFHAIRLVSRNKHAHVTNFREILKELEVSFLQHKETQTLAQQNYDDILSELNSDDSHSLKNIINFKSKTKYYFPYTTDEESKIDKLFNSKDIYVASKIYAFDHSKVKGEDVAQQLGFHLIQPKISEEFTINFDKGYLNKISLGEKEVTVSGNSPLTVIVPKGEQPKAYVGNKNEGKTIYGNISFNKPSPPPPKPIIPSGPSGPSTGVKVKLNLILGIMGGLIVLASTSLWYLEKWPFNKEVQSPIVMVDESQEKQALDSLTVKPTLYSFVMIDSTSSKKNTYYYTDSIKEIKGYRFTPVGNNWIYYENHEMIINGDKSKNNLSQDGLNEFIKKYSIDGEEWNRFADSLKVRLGSEVPKYKKEVERKPKPNGEKNEEKNEEKLKEEKGDNNESEGSLEIKTDIF